MNAEASLGKKTVTNILWNYGTFAASKAVVFITTIILARLLTPADFGLLAIGLLALNYLDILSNFGVSSALIYQKADTEKAANTAFVLAVISGLLLTILGILTAPYVAVFFREPRVTDILRVLSISLLISNVGSIHQARFMKNLDFRRRTIPEIGKAIVKGGVSIIMALLGFGVWSLVWGQLAGVTTGTALSWIVLRWRPRLEIDRQLACGLMIYGFNIILIGLQATILNNIDYLFIGRRMGAEELGYYTLAFRLPELIVINFVVVVGQALFPTYAKQQDDLSMLQRGFLKVERYVALIIVPIGIGLWAIAPEFVRIFYSEKWASAITVMQILSIYAIIYALSYNAGDIFKAIGKPGILNKIALVRVILIVPILYVASSYTIVHVAIGQLAANILITFLTIGVIIRTINIRPADILAEIRPALLSGVLMAAGLLGVRMSIAPLGDLPSLVILVIAGVVLYTGAYWLIDRDSARDMLASLKPLRARLLDRQSQGL